MVSKRAFHVATLLSNGNVLVTGGMASKVSLSSAEVYDVVAGSFGGTTGPMMTARDSHFAVLLAMEPCWFPGAPSAPAPASRLSSTTPRAEPLPKQEVGTGRALAAAVLLQCQTVECS